MVFRRIKYMALFYITLIILFFGSAVYVLFNTYFWLTSIWLLISGILGIILLIRLIMKEHKKLSYFLLSINQDDFNPPSIKNYGDTELNKAFEKLSFVIKTLRDEAQINYQYLQTVVGQIKTAIICVDKTDKIVLSNNAAEKLFEKKVLRNIDSLQLLDSHMPDILRNLRFGEKKLVKIKLNNSLQNFSIEFTDFKIQDESLRLFTFQNVQNELEQNEIESWQKLTRVISHEIMNSAIPISNLSSLVRMRLFNDLGKLEELGSDIEEDVRESLRTIESRSKGLVDFINSTRSFTKMPNPKFENVSTGDIITRVETLLKPKLLELNVHWEIKMEESLEIIADKPLVEQVLINLMLNAVDAVKDIGAPEIKITAFRNSENKVLISIEDNGVGIAEKDIENIFIPFYTTKVKGSGIGLSLARQIMFLHKGNISVNSKTGFGTKFVISF